jgi:hypothetical protein
MIVLPDNCGLFFMRGFDPLHGEAKHSAAIFATGCKIEAIKPFFLVLVQALKSREQALGSRKYGRNTLKQGAAKAPREYCDAWWLE